MNNIDSVTTQISQFGADIHTGLSTSPKTLSSKYFYDKRGDELFQKIMHLDEYYLTRSELQIFERQKDRLLQIIGRDEKFRLVELGAGDGLKTRVLLKYFLNQGVEFSYSPVDISGNVLSVLENNLLSEIPQLDIDTLEGDYFEVLADLKFRHEAKSVVFFLGSNIGNFMVNTARGFIKSIHDNLQEGDILMLGFDLKKDPERILNAYNDGQGVTSAFNKNLLSRINQELGGDFEPDKFRHSPVYDPVSGECRSYLISLEEQTVYIEANDTSYQFEQWEPIFMEVSKKYSVAEIEALAELCGFEVLEHVFDEERLFADTIWKVR